MGHFIRDAFRSMKQNARLVFSSISAIAICLLILGLAAIAFNVLDDSLQSASEKNQYIAYVKDTLSDSQAYSLQITLEEIENVKTVEFVSKETAQKEFADYLQSSTLAELPASIFRNRFVITFENGDRVQTAIAQIETTPGIEYVAGDTGVAEGYRQMRQGLQIVAIAAIVLLLVISIVVISNAMSASFERKKRETQIMRLCGVSESHIRGPMAWEGFFIGLFSAALAFLLLWAFYHSLYLILLNASLVQMLEMPRFLTFGIPVGIVYLVAGGALGAIIGRFAGSRKKSKHQKGVVER